ncbi:MAG: hypothetical protein AAF798_14505 [Bacteroidota bacterium]
MCKTQEETAQEPKGGALSKFEKLALPEEQLLEVKGGNGGDDPPPEEGQKVNGHEDIVIL